MEYQISSLQYGLLHLLLFGNRFYFITACHEFNCLLQDQVKGLYARLSSRPIRVQKRGAHIGGVGFGFSNFVMFNIYALAFYYGGVLIESGDIEIDDLFISFFCVMFAAMGATEVRLELEQQLLRLFQ